MNKLKSYTLVGLQFLCIAILGFTSQEVSAFSGLIALLGVIIGVWAIYVMKKSKLHITPDVDKEALLVTKGPYKYIRHPMYTAVLLFCLGLLLSPFSLVRLVIYIALIAVLLSKLMYEEQLLEKHFSQYGDYKKKTYRLVPFVF